MADLTSIQYLGAAAAQAIATYINSVCTPEMGGPPLLGSAINSDTGDLEDDFRRILEINKSTGQGTGQDANVTNKQVLPFLVCYLTGVDTHTVPGSKPQNKRQQYISDDSTKYGVFRMVDMVMKGRVYVTTAGQAQDFLQCCLLHESLTFVGTYSIPWLPALPMGAPPPSVQVRLGAPSVAKYSALKDLGQLWGMEFTAQIHGNLYSQPSDVAVITRINCSFYDWQAGGDSPIGNSVLLDLQVVE